MLILKVIFVISLLFAFSDEGILVVLETYDHESEKKSISKIYVGENRVRMESGEEEIFIFLLDKEKVWFINKTENTYVELTKEDMQELKAKMEGMMNEYMMKMKEELNNMPPEQRKMVEEMMQSQMDMTGEGPQIYYKKVASGEKMNGWICDKYEGYRKEQKVEEVWTADEAEAGMSPKEFNTLKRMFATLDAFDMQGIQLYEFGSKEAEELQKYSGIPVKTIELNEEGQAKETTKLKETKKQDFEDSFFQLPEGLKKVTWEEMN